MRLERRAAAHVGSADEVRTTKHASFPSASQRDGQGDNLSMRYRGAALPIADSGMQHRLRLERALRLLEHAFSRTPHRCRTWSWAV